MTQAFARTARAAAAATLLACSVPGPALAQFARSDAAPSARANVDRDFLIGTWSNDGDCETTVAFAPDGGYATGDGLQGQWSLTGDTLTLSGEAGATRLTIIPIDRDTMEVIGEDGSHDRSTRCAGQLGNVRFDDLRIS
ncbi:MAG TPA: hypothetical protein VEC11_02310 [Allosphingosinicella sp.]|nr:hypothetical protein [Allosphingosinicella sp.]